MDDRLHAERVGLDRSKRTHRARLGTLPDGVLVQLAERDVTAWLLWRGALLAWSPGGYTQQIPVVPGDLVTVLTPQSTVAAIRQGYVPEVHPSVHSYPS
jgi:hypothetical protein